MTLDHRRFRLGETEGMFEVEPWEVKEEPNEFEFPSLQVVSWEGKQWEVALEQLPGHNQQLHFRLVGGPLLTPDNWRFKPHGPEQREEQMKRRIIECLQQENWWREIHLNAHFHLRKAQEQSCYSLSVSPDGSGDLRGQHRWSVPFRWRAIDLLQTPASDLMAHLESEPDFRFACDYISMSEDERWQQTWVWKRGDQHELKQAMTWAFLAEEELWANEADLWLRLSLVRNENNSGVKVFSGPTVIQGQRAPCPLSPSLHEALLNATNHFGPTLRWQHIEQHEVLLQLLKTDFWRIDIHPENPSAHERIEAALQWREWLAKHNRTP